MCMNNSAMSNNDNIMIITNVKPQHDCIIIIIIIIIMYVYHYHQLCVLMQALDIILCEGFYRLGFE